MSNKKRERFIKVASDRTNRIIYTLKLLSNCSNKNNYDYSKAEVKRIFGAIEEELEFVKNSFIRKTKAKTSFYLETHKNKNLK